LQSEYQRDTFDKKEIHYDTATEFTANSKTQLSLI
jgi:hypothetical protein